VLQLLSEFLTTPVFGRAAFSIAIAISLLCGFDKVDIARAQRIVLPMVAFAAIRASCHVKLAGSFEPVAQCCYQCLYLSSLVTRGTLYNSNVHEIP
jgi:hypothetical protein